LRGRGGGFLGHGAPGGIFPWFQSLAAPGGGGGGPSVFGEKNTPKGAGEDPRGGRGDHNLIGGKKKDRGARVKKMGRGKGVWGACGLSRAGNPLKKPKNRFFPDFRGKA